MLLHITNRCRMACPHCMDNADPNGPIMSIDTCQRAIAFAKDGGDRLLIVSGGEPTEHPQLYDICRLIAHARLNFSICTNGMFMGDPKKEWTFEKVTQLRGYCGSQLYTNPKWYRLHRQTLAKYESNRPKYERWKVLLDTSEIRAMKDIGRARDNPQALAEAESSPYHNSCLSACLTLAQTTTPKDFFDLMFMQTRFCTPLIDCAGNIHLSESWLCPSVGNVNTDPFESIWLKMRQFRPCGGCLGCKRYLTEDTPKMVAARRLLGQSAKEGNANGD